jgi:hypothetical protein
MTFPKPPQAASVAITTFLGAAIGSVVPLLNAGPIESGAQARAALVGAIMAGLSAVVHLYQPVPVPQVKP